MRQNALNYVEMHVFPLLWGESRANMGFLCSGENHVRICVRSCSGENILWGEEENWQKRRKFSKFSEKLERFWKN